MKTTHTPGPWTFNELHPLTVEAAGKRVALIYDHNGPQGKATYHANARLIAAAPRMLEALKELFADVHTGKMTCKDSATLVRLHAAIAEATHE